MRRCLGCFERISEELEICPFCGYIEGTPPEDLLYLEPGTILAGRYMIGKFKKKNSSSLMYAAWDLEANIRLDIKEYFPEDCATRIVGSPDVVVRSEARKKQYDAGFEDFVKEAKNLFSNSNRIKLFDCIAENGTAYMILEYSEKTTALDSVIDAVTPIQKKSAEVYEKTRDKVKTMNLGERFSEITKRVHPCIKSAWDKISYGAKAVFNKLKVNSILRKILILALIVAVLFFIYKFASNRPKGLSGIRSDLIADTDFLPKENMTVDNVDIRKRQTNEDNGTDYVYIDIVAHNDDISVNASYELFYRHYNDGWVLDYINAYEREDWDIEPLRGPSQREAEAAIDELGYSDTEYEYSNSDLNLHDHVCTCYYDSYEYDESYYNSYYYSCVYGYMIKSYSIEFTFNERTAEWDAGRLTYEGSTTVWSNLEGTYRSDSYDMGWVSDEVRLEMTIDQITDSRIHVSIYDWQTNESYYDDYIDLSVTTPLGTDFDSLPYITIPITENLGYGNTDTYEKQMKIIISLQTVELSTTSMFGSVCIFYRVS